MAFGVILAALPATADTISFTTAPASQNVAASGETNSYFNYQGVTVNTTYTPSGTAFTGSATDSFGYLSFANGVAPPAGTSNVIDVTLNTPTINGGQQASVTFDGTVTSQVLSGVTVYNVNFTGASGTTTIGGVQYADVISNGVTYAIQATQQLNTKYTYLNGYILGVPPPTAPEPATIATTGLALALAGLIARRKASGNK